MTEVIWNSLLELKNLLSSCYQKNFSVQVYYTDNNFHIQLGIAEIGQKPQIKFKFNCNYELTFCWDEDFNLLEASDLTNKKEDQFIKAYLPYCFISLRAHKLKRTFGISHYAQSLDGKIATLEGKSKWISQQEDLVHCHRMRALCDGILIGINTLRTDQPKLNVRHVKGNNPVRIILGSSFANFSSLMINKGRIIHFTSNPSKVLPGIEQITLPQTIDTPVFVMKSLYKMGIQSVFIEGGSATTSSFMESQMIDEVQLYLSPSVFGSGLPNFNLPVIRNVDEAIVFSKHEFIPMGMGILFKGEVNRIPKQQSIVNN